MLKTPKNKRFYFPLVGLFHEVRTPSLPRPRLTPIHPPLLHTCAMIVQGFLVELARPVRLHLHDDRVGRLREILQLQLARALALAVIPVPDDNPHHHHHIVLFRKAIQRGEIPLLHRDIGRCAVQPPCARLERLAREGGGEVGREERGFGPARKFAVRAMLYQLKDLQKCTITEFLKGYIC